MMARTSLTNIVLLLIIGQPQRTGTTGIAHQRTELGEPQLNAVKLPAYEFLQLLPLLRRCS